MVLFFRFCSICYSLRLHGQTSEIRISGAFINSNNDKGCRKLVRLAWISWIFKWTMDARFIYHKVDRHTVSQYQWIAIKAITIEDSSNQKSIRWIILFMACKQKWAIRFKHLIGDPAIQHIYLAYILHYNYDYIGFCNQHLTRFSKLYRFYISFI